MTKYIFCKEKFVARMIEKRLIKIGAIDCEEAYVHARYDAYNQKYVQLGEQLRWQNLYIRWN